MKSPTNTFNFKCFHNSSIKIETNQNYHHLRLVPELPPVPRLEHRHTVLLVLLLDPPSQKNYKLAIVDRSKSTNSLVSQKFLQPSYHRK